MQLDILKKKINGIQRAQMILVNGKEYHGVIDEIVHVSVHVMHVPPPPHFCRGPLARNPRFADMHH